MSRASEIEKAASSLLYEVDRVLGPGYTNDPKTSMLAGSEFRALCRALALPRDEPAPVAWGVERKSDGVIAFASPRRGSIDDVLASLFDRGGYRIVPLVRGQETT